MYENVSFEKILERMLGRVPDKLDKREGSVIYDAISPTALELMKVYIELERILKEGFGDTASREFLIKRCSERGISPYEATNAVLKGEFTPTNINVTGKRFNIGSMNFIATEKIADGEYQMQCETPGVVGNQQLGTMIPIEYIQGLETAELTDVLIPGEDEEDTEDLRTRYFDSFNEKAFGGNVQDYLEKVGAIPGVGGVKVTRVWNSDIRPAEMIPDERVKDWYQSFVPPDDIVKGWLDTVYKAASEKKLTVGGTVLITITNSDYGEASETLMETVSQTLDPEQYAGEGLGLAPIGHIVSIKSVEAVEVTVSSQITFEKGYSWDNMTEVIKEAAEKYLKELREGWQDSDSLTLRKSRLEARILELEGVVDMEHTAFNGREENLVLGKYQIPVLKGLEPWR